MVQKYPVAERGLSKYTAPPPKFVGIGKYELPSRDPMKFFDRRRSLPFPVLQVRAVWSYKAGNSPSLITLTSCARLGTSSKDMARRNRYSGIGCNSSRGQNLKIEEYYDIGSRLTEESSGGSGEVVKG
eukprot:2669121-Rhodomonas_salina.4